MKTTTLGRKDFTARDGYLCYDAALNVHGHLLIEGDLGRLKFKTSVAASGQITVAAGSGIEAGWGIEAGEGIVAGSGIKAGSGIEAGEGIEAKTLSVTLRIFAGLCMWCIPAPEEMEIRAKVISGTVCHGTIIETT